jgi:hypothetical protein
LKNVFLELKNSYPTFSITKRNQEPMQNTTGHKTYFKTNLTTPKTPLNEIS